jgi:deoxycytidine triphosphate deaminase
MNINPLDINLKGRRFLNDRGIKQAIDYGFININPKIDFKKDTKRLQPATLDLKIQQIENLDKFKLPAKSNQDVLLTEQILHNSQLPELNVDFIFPKIDGRSSVRRLGCYVPNNGSLFFAQSEGTIIELNNYSHNNIIFDEGERIVQAFFMIDPFKDQWLGGYDLNTIRFMNIKEPRSVKKRLDEIFEKARTLDMGIEITTNEQLKYLYKEGYLEVKPELKIKDGYVLVHASNNASIINKLGDIYFSKRKEYSDKIKTSFNINKGYIINPQEHIDIETIESFKLSKYVGIHFYNNPLKKMHKSMHKDKPEDIINNLYLTQMIDGWVDPNYEGPFSRQPKWSSKINVKPKDPIGFGRVIFYPNGVEQGYGSESLGSQYNKKKATIISD